VEKQGRRAHRRGVRGGSPGWATAVVRITSLEGVCRTAVRATQLGTLMLVSVRGGPLITVANGPLMAWRPLRPELAAPRSVWRSSLLAPCAGGRAGWRLSGGVAVLDCCTAPASSAHALGALPSGNPSGCGVPRAGAGKILPRPRRTVGGETAGRPEPYAAGSGAAAPGGDSSLGPCRPDARRLPVWARTRHPSPGVHPLAVGRPSSHFVPVI